MTHAKKIFLKANEVQFSTPLGEMIALTTDNAVVWLSFTHDAKSKKYFSDFKKKYVTHVSFEANEVGLALKKYIDAYFSGESTPMTFTLNALGTPFQQRVWAALQNIPTGETRAYADVAAALNHPKAFRAVANANGKNPICLLIPCHRVINTNGSLGGYSGGIHIKAALLAHEGVTSVAAQPQK